MSTRASILVACIGNIFLGDDGFGCEVARALAAAKIHPDAEVIDFGIRGFDLAFALLEPFEAVILVDAVVRGSRPGTISILQPENSGNSMAEAAFDPHSMDPARLLAMARSLGQITSEIYIVGCEPLDFGDELEGRMGLSEAVMTSIPEAVQAIAELIRRLDQQRPRPAEEAFAIQQDQEEL